MEKLLFLTLAGIAIGAALNLLLSRRPIYSALSLIGVMGALAVLYLLLGAEFIAAVQVIVYAGAIMVLFVFVIMLLNAGEEVRTNRSLLARLLGLPVILVRRPPAPAGPSVDGIPAALDWILLSALDPMS